MESDDSPQLKGFVIITLPPPDNPSLGKTITAFTISDSPPEPHQSPPQEQTHHNHQNHVPLQSPPNPQLQFPFTRFKLFLGNQRKLFLFLGISLFALAFCTFVFPKAVEEFERSNDDEGIKSFVLPLFPKLGIRGQNDAELKLGRFVDFDKENLAAPIGDVIRNQKINKLVSSMNSVDSSTILPVRGNVYPDGLYYTYILVGNPRRPYYLDMDTGSDLAWIQCDAPCTSCAKGANPLYKPTRGNILPSKDSLCTEIQRNQKAGNCETCQCDYEIQYADHSSSIGVLAKDELHLKNANGSLTNMDIVFGCAYDQQGILLNTLSKTDGILGLSRAKVSLPSQLASKGIINNVIGHCLTADADGGGYMFLGDDYVPQKGMSWAPMLNIPSKDFYHTEIVRISYGSSPLNLGAWGSGVRRIVFDSGSSYTYFTKEAYSDLVESLKEVSGPVLVQDVSDPTLPICWRARVPLRSVTEVKQLFKTLTLQFASKWWTVSPKIRIPPEGYLIISSKGNVCLGILDGSKVHDGSTIILGDISLRGHMVVYDNVNQKIGWAKSDCVNPIRFKSPPSFQ
ncbi:aspartyl protease APCB1 [Ziziphus jujuba]|uniref:Aspartyl protease APCB1 n=1 Tax=Ziziphus jujuba TaxID=326968 RepID=A0A6P3ZQC1_ZIZJJ|nr:aspartyl protease APCB1 [Ziziphus jujuba]